MKNLTQSQRDKLEALIRLNISLIRSGKPKAVSQIDIGNILGCHQSTISRELNRNKSSTGIRYTSNTAQQAAINKRLLSKGIYPIWTKDLKLKEYIVSELKDGKSPEQIRGRLKLKKEYYISTPTIYTFIKRDKNNGGTLYKYLRYQGKKYKWHGFGASRIRIPHRNSIDNRPKIIDLKERFGDWESDLVVSPMSGSGALATFAERKSMYCRAIIIPTKEASNMVRATKEALGSYPDEMSASMTHDNGLEIAKHEEITKALNMPVYCAHPYSSWERGLNEWMNRELRRFFPKGTDFSKIKQKAVDYAVNWLNNCPRKTLGYRTPREVFEEQLEIMRFKV